MKTLRLIAMTPVWLVGGVLAALLGAAVVFVTILFVGLSEVFEDIHANWTE